MKSEECKAGMVVYHRHDGPSYRYEIINEADFQGTVTCKEEDGSRTYSFSAEFLIPYDLEALKQKGTELQAKVDKAKAAFEVAFEALREIQNADTDGVGHYTLSEMALLDTSELEKVIDDSGWSSSSLWC